MAQLSLYKFVNPGGVRDKNLESITINAQKFLIRKGSGNQQSQMTDRTNGYNAYGRKTILGINRLGSSVNSTIITVKSLNDNLRSLTDNVSKSETKRAKFEKFQYNYQKKLLKLKQDRDKRDQNTARRESDRASETSSEKGGVGKFFSPIKNIAKKAAGGFLDFIQNLLQLIIKAALVSGVLKWIMDPQNTEKVGKFFLTIRKIFEFFMGLINFGVTNMLDGVSKIIDGNIFEKIVGVVQFLVGAFVLFKSLSWLRNPFNLLRDIKNSFKILKLLPKALSIAARAAKAIFMAAKGMPGWGKALAVGTVLFTAGATIPAMFPESVNEQERKTDKAPGSNEEKIKSLEEQKSKLNPLDQLQGKGSEIDEQIHYLKTGKTKEYATGGIAKGPDSGYPAILHGTEAIIPLDNKYTRSGGDPLANISDGVSKGISDAKIAPAIAEAMKLPFKAVGASLLANLGNVVSASGQVGELTKPFIKQLATPIAQSFGVPANLFDVVTAKDKIKDAKSSESGDDGLADKIGTGNITINNPSESGQWKPGGNKTVRGLLADVVSGLLFMTKKVDKKNKSTGGQQKIPDTTPGQGAAEDSIDESSSSAVAANKETGAGSQDLNPQRMPGASTNTQSGQTSQTRSKFDASNEKANRRNLPFKGPDGVTNYEVKLNATNGDYEVWKHNGILGWQQLDISKDLNTLQKQKAFNQVRSFYVKHAQKKGLALNYISPTDVENRQELIKKYDAEAKSKGVDTSSKPPAGGGMGGARGSGASPTRAAGGWISGPQSGYPVSLDGGKSTAFIGHGTEWVGMKKADGGQASSAFVIPYDTPKTKSNSNLTSKRYQEAKSGGYALPGFAAGGEVRPGEEKNKPKAHPYLEKLSDGKIKKVSAPVGYCVTGSLNTMQSSGVPNPAGTGNDVGNNPRGAIVQLVKQFGWKSIGGNATTLKSPYGSVSTGVFNKGEYSKAVDEGKVPSGALIFQTRHSDWNGTSHNSRGYDMAIAQKKGNALWNGQPLGRWVYGGTTKVVALTPGGVQGDGSPASESGPSSGSTADGTGTSSGGGEQQSNWMDALKDAFSGKTAANLLGVSAPAATASTTPTSTSTGSPTSTVSGQDLTKMTTDQLRKMLDPTQPGATNPAIFEAAKKAREEAKAKGLTGEALEREVLMSTIRSKNGVSPSDIKPGAPPSSGTQVSQQTSQLKDAKAAENNKPQVSTVNTGGTVNKAQSSGGVVHISSGGGQPKKGSTDFLIPQGSPLTNYVGSDGLHLIK